MPVGRRSCRTSSRARWGAYSPLVFRYRCVAAHRAWCLPRHRGTSKGCSQWPAFLRRQVTMTPPSLVKLGTKLATLHISQSPLLTPILWVQHAIPRTSATNKVKRLLCVAVEPPIPPRSPHTQKCSPAPWHQRAGAQVAEGRTQQCITLKTPVAFSRGASPQWLLPVMHCCTVDALHC